MRGHHLLQQHQQQQQQQPPQRQHLPAQEDPDGMAVTLPPATQSPSLNAATDGAYNEHPSNRSGSGGGLWAPLYRHISMQRYDSTCSDDHPDDDALPHPRGHNANSASGAAKRWALWWRTCLVRRRTAELSSRGVKLGLASAVAVFLVLLVWQTTLYRESPHRRPIPIESAQEHLLDLGDGLKLWFRVWGDRTAGVPVLFVHGGPGNAIADYEMGNAHFFDYRQFYVVEVDQRGTGQSQPSVRDGCRNMRYYEDIGIEQMSHDFERVREYLRIERWLVFGGSWGSTLSLDYAERYPDRVLGLIIRGIYLNTRAEFDAVYTRSAHLGYPQRLREFDRWFVKAQREVELAGESPLDPDDAQRFFQVYRRLLLRCDKYAIWHWFVFENNLMETIPENLRDPDRIDRDQYPEALSVSFFENFLFYRGTFEDPPRLLERLHHLKSVPVWICQGLYDEVCPQRYARQLVDGLETAHVNVRAHFVESGHEATDPVMARCLIRRVDDFLQSLDGRR